MLLVRRALALSSTHAMSSALGVRALRTGRRGVQRQLKVRPVPDNFEEIPTNAGHDQSSLRALAATRTSTRNRRASISKIAPPPPVKHKQERPLIVLPPLIRVRDLAKALKLPLDDVLKRVATRANRKLHMRWGDRDASRFEFKNVKQVIVPFDMARDVAIHFNRRVAFDPIEPTFTTAALNEAHAAVRTPVIAVMGHVDHGKTTLLDALRSTAAAAQTTRERHNITQKINVASAQLTPTLRATFLDTPGHFHFFRMRTTAAHVADVALLVVAADDGVGRQTDESIGALEDAAIPIIVCLNKIDVATATQIEQVTNDLRSYVALQHAPIVPISATAKLHLGDLQAAIAAVVETPAAQLQRRVDVRPHALAEGIVLESVAATGRGTVLRVLLRTGVLHKHDHFVAGMIHGSVRSLRAPDGLELAHALPGTVVDVAFANKTKNVDAPNELGFFALSEKRAAQVLELRQLALDIDECLVDGSSYEQRMGRDFGPYDDEEEAAYDENEAEDEDEELNEDDLIETMSVIVKADGAGSLVSIQDTVDTMLGISTARIGIGNITTKDIDVAINGKCPIFGFNVKLHPKEKQLAAARGVRVILHSTIHELIADIAALDTSDLSATSDKKV